MALLAQAGSLLARALPIEVTDDQGHQVRLTAPAQRVITLSPHATELVFAAGGGERIVATVNASDFPPAARTLPRIGDGLSPNPERVLLTRPDLVIGWQPSQFSSLSSLAIPTFLSNPKTLKSIPDSIEILGNLLGTSETANTRAASLKQTLERLKQYTSTKTPVRVFIQVGDEPEYTLNRSHLLSHLIEQCGGINIFSAAAATAPKISAESVLSQKPDLILLGRIGATAEPTTDSSALSYWRRLNLPAAMLGQIFVMDSDVLYRPGPRLIEAAETICSLIQQARK
ncbi:cobalamin-binding protein [Zwartia sp.]|uniref:cobalamin-binding protein n=1 Tax=Zwartia sp. TaxID=2978004 RepID=UPI0027268FBF|nr:cobalamin-binding protein [Zwartia sp.]MDO9025607.1 cobalamin-binding protein [Zwartia sp.]